MINILTDLSLQEGGKRFLLNLFMSVKSRHVDTELAAEVIDKLKGAATDPGWHPYYPHLLRLIFADPDGYQFKGPPPKDCDAEWMTVKSMGDLMLFITENAGGSADALRSALGVPVLAAPSKMIGTDYYLRFADVISDEDFQVKFLLAKRFDDPRNKGALRAAPTWYSRWCKLPRRVSGQPKPSEAISGRIRDWLGLPYDGGEPLFVIRSRKATPVQELRAHRPTALDGFDNPFYKHNTIPARQKEGQGSAADLFSVRKGKRVLRDVEGGPELISRGVEFDPQHFLCEFIGVVPRLDYDKHDKSFHTLLLDDGLTINDAILEFERLLNAGKGTLA